MKCVCFNCQRSPKFDTSWYKPCLCLCIVVPMGRPYASGVLSAFLRVSRQQKTYSHVLFVVLCHVCIFFLSNKQLSWFSWLILWFRGVHDLNRLLSTHWKIVIFVKKWIWKSHCNIYTTFKKYHTNGCTCVNPKANLKSYVIEYTLTYIYLWIFLKL